ncbi:hypothetical protein GCM10025778_10950 [Paeniglutamicibacter antarcticus]|uniref:Uncharacterized protein n=1 Tax=Paeniglutamicibacter antarcticus TaxID=494023 RepID=A0ABP9TJ29_9MICC
MVVPKSSGAGHPVGRWAKWIWVLDWIVMENVSLALEVCESQRRGAAGLEAQRTTAASVAKV